MTSRERGLTSTGVVLLHAMRVRVVRPAEDEPGVEGTMNVVATEQARQTRQVRRTSTDTSRCWVVDGPIITPRTGVTSA